MTDVQRFQPGDRVRVRDHCPDGNPRTPGYVRGKQGVVTELHGMIENPLDHRGIYPPLYTIRFTVSNLGGPTGDDVVLADIHDEWLEGTEVAL